MAVEELIELLKQLDPKKEVICGDNQANIYDVEEWKNCIFLSTTEDCDYRLIWN